MHRVKMRKIGLIVGIVACLSPMTGNATPPQIIAVAETILGENDTHLFLLRRIDDNLGFHHTRQTDMVLIARNLSTGRDDDTWRVLSILDHGPEFADYGQPKRVENLGAADRVNPFDVLLWRQARVAPPDGAKRTAGSARITGDGIEVAEGDAVPTHRIPLADVMPRVAASLRATRRLMPARKLETGSDPLLETHVDIPAGYRVGALHRSMAPTDPNRLCYAVRLDCTDQDELVQLSLYVVVPPTK